MARKPRISPGGLAYHVMNRAWGNIDLFENPRDYEAFEKAVSEALARHPSMRLCAYCLMPSHFHLVLWPGRDGELSRFMQWLSMTHTQRRHAQRPSGGRGHLYQSRFKSFAIQKDGHFLSVCRYVERNALRANKSRRAENWQWCSLWVRANHGGLLNGLLAEWPTPMPRDWIKRVNQPQDEKELAALRLSRDRDRPYGDDHWVQATAKKLGVQSSLRPIGRPKKRSRGKIGL